VEVEELVEEVLVTRELPPVMLLVAGMMISSQADVIYVENMGIGLIGVHINILWELSAEDPKVGLSLLIALDLEDKQDTLERQWVLVEGLV